MALPIDEMVADAVKAVVVTTEKSVDEIIAERIEAIPKIEPMVGIAAATFEARLKYIELTTPVKKIEILPERRIELPLIKNLAASEYRRRQDLIENIRLGKFAKPVIPQQRVDAGLFIAVANRTNGLKSKVQQLIDDGLFDWSTATTAERAIAKSIYYNIKDDNAKAIGDRIKGKTRRDKIVSANKRRSQNKPKQARTGFIKTRISFGIPLETWTKNFDKVNLTVGKYKFIYKGDNPQKILPNNTNLPIYGSAEGKEFVIRLLRSVHLDNNQEGLEIIVDLNQNIIPLLLVAGAVGGTLLGGTGFVLHKTQKIMSSSIIWVIAIIVIGFLFLRFKAAGVV